MRPPKAPRRIEFPFVLDELDPLPITLSTMFGCTSVYSGGKILLVMRDRPTETADNGVWIATTHEHHESLRAELPSLRTIALFGVRESGWQNLPADAPTFERDVVRACELAKARDPRIGKVPGSKAKKAAGDTGSGKPKKAPPKPRGAVVAPARRKPRGRA